MYFTITTKCFYLYKGATIYLAICIIKQIFAFATKDIASMFISFTVYFNYFSYYFLFRCSFIIYFFCNISFFPTLFIYSFYFKYKIIALIYYYTNNEYSSIYIIY